MSLLRMSLLSLLFIAPCTGQIQISREQHGWGSQGRLLEQSREAKTWLEERGFSGQLSFVNDWSSNVGGGVRPDSSFDRYSVDVSLGVDGGKLLGWKGTRVLVRVKHHFGEQGGDYVGDAQGFSNIDSVPKTYLYELWIQQSLWSDRLRFKLGKIDANAEYAVVNSAADFLNSSMGYSPTILAFPTYPEPRPGANLFFRTGRYRFGMGLFGTAGKKNMWILEGGRDWSIGGHKLAGRSSFGTWGIAGRLQCFDGDELVGTHGYYLIAEQAVWSRPRGNGGAQSVSAFVQYGSANGEVSPFTQHIGAGLVLESPLATRSRDAVGVAVTSVQLSDAMESGLERTHETTTEIYYRLSLTRFLSVVPDLQFIRNPAGIRHQPPAIVFTPRLTISF